MMSEAAAASATPVLPRKRRVGSLGFIALVVLAVLVFRSFVFAPFTIPSESMLPGLAKGDYLIAAKWPYGWSRWSLPLDAPLIADTLFARLPERGDVAIFRHPITHTEYIKRVIGLPGDVVMLRDGVLNLNGAAVAQRRLADFRVTDRDNAACPWGAKDEPGTDRDTACRYTRLRETLPNGVSYAVLDFGRTAQDSYGPVTVPTGHLFMLGDNRDNSQDSRFPAQPGGGVGMVPVGLLVGRFQTVLFSTAGWPSWLVGGRGRRLGAS